MLELIGFAALLALFARRPASSSSSSDVALADHDDDGEDAVLPSGPGPHPFEASYPFARTLSGQRLVVKIAQPRPKSAGSVVVDLVIQSRRTDGAALAASDPTYCKAVSIARAYAFDAAGHLTVASSGQAAMLQCSDELEHDPLLWNPRVIAAGSWLAIEVTVPHDDDGEHRGWAVHLNGEGTLA